jgi:hypothetical protein
VRAPRRKEKKGGISGYTAGWLTSDFQTLGLDIFNDLQSGPGDVLHVLAMAVFTKEAGCADNNVEAIYTGFNG